MAYTYGTIQTELQAELDNDDSFALVLIKQKINDVCREIWHFAHWYFRSTTEYLNTTDEVAEYDLNSLIPDYLAIQSVGYKGENDTEFRSLKEMSLQAYDGQNRDTTNASSPIRWILRNKTLILWPKPDYTGTDNLKIAYEKKFTELVNDDDVPIIPVDYKAEIKCGVRGYFWQLDDDLRADGELYQFHGRDGEGGMLAAMRKTAIDQTNSPKKGHLFYAK